MTQYYSAKTGEFYDSHSHKTLPDDAVKIGDPNAILATRKYVDDTVQKNRGEIEQTVKESFAPLNNPALTGIPTGPTPTADNDSEQLATTAFVQALGQRYVTPEQGDTRYWKRDEELFPALQNGYQIQPSGLIMQWGFVEKPPYSGVKVTYPIAFPHAVFSVCATNAGLPLRSGINALNVLVKGTEDFQLYCDHHDASPAVDGFWLALGY